MLYVEKFKPLAITIFPSCVVALRYLPPAGYAWLTGEKFVSSISKLIGLRLRHRSRPDNR